MINIFFERIKRAIGWHRITTSMSIAGSPDSMRKFRINPDSGDPLSRGQRSCCDALGLTALPPEDILVLGHSPSSGYPGDSFHMCP